DEVLDQVKQKPKPEEEEFKIIDVKQEEDQPKIEEEEQITLTFNLPLNNDKEKEEKEVENKVEPIRFSLDDEVKDMKVKDHVEIIPVTEANKKGEIRYALDDTVRFESSMNSSTKTQVEEEIVFEKKTVEKPSTNEGDDSEADPINKPISELMKERADERRRKMKDFNYKFNNAKIDEIEKTPAYKRQGVNLEEADHSSEKIASRVSVTNDDNDDVQLRNNNSFLHDNVD
ncbi:MAG: cell division protein FtsZ, partial [Flavobacteriaceae bacterium]|nr:cell division protein FtsZ [Flavobacteriaceae bacterium]